MDSEAKSSAGLAGSGLSVRAVHGLFFLSGASALIYEIAWSRMLVHSFGSTLFSVSTVLTVFMAGLGLGSALGGKFCEQLRSPLICYALIEGGIGLYGLLSLILFSEDALGPLIFSISSSWSFDAMAAVKALLTAALLLLPTCLMGATYPILSRWMALRSPALRQEIGYLYAVNIGGAVLGTLSAGFLLIPGLGLVRSIAVAAVLNFAVALAGLFLGKFASAEEIVGQASFAVQESKKKSPAFKMALLLSLCLTSALAMVLEVAWSRYFSLLLGSTTYAFSLVVATFLAGQAVGAFLISRKLDSLKHPVQVFAVLLLLTGCYLYMMVASLNELPWVLVIATKTISRLSGSLSFFSQLASRAVVASLIMLVPAGLLGAVLPLVLRIMVGGRQTAGQTAGLVYSWQCAGSVIGPWLGGFVLIPRFSIIFESGLQVTFIAAAIAAVSVATLLFLSWWNSEKRLVSGFLVNAWLVGSCLFLGCVWIYVRPPWDPMRMSAGVSFLGPSELEAMDRERFDRLTSRKGDETSPGRLLFYREGLNTTVTVEESPSNNTTCLKNDGKVEASIPTNPGQPAFFSDLPTQTLLGQLPCLVHPDVPESAFVVGYGSGATVGALLASPQVKNVKVLELEPAVYAADRFFQPTNGSPLVDKRVDGLVGDARNYLSLNSRKYDLIVSQPADPWVNGMTDLFTQEFWQLCRRHLKERGIMCQWVQLYAVNPEYLAVLLRTFQKVFPHTMIFRPVNAGELIVLGSAQPFQIDVSKLKERMKDGKVAALLSRIDYSGEEKILSTFVAGPDQLSSLIEMLAPSGEDERVNTDDNLLTEFRLPEVMLSSFAVSKKTIERLAGSPLNFDSLLCGAGGHAHSGDLLARIALIKIDQIRSPEDPRIERLKRFIQSAEKHHAGPAIFFAHYELAKRAGDQSDVDRLAKLVLQLPARTVMDYLCQGKLFLARSELDAAVGCFIKACEIAPDFAPAHLALAGAYYRQGRYEKSLDQFDSAASLQPFDPQSLYGIALSELALNRNGDGVVNALQSVGKALAVRPDHFASRLLEARLLLQSGRVNQGLKDLKLASRLEPADPLPNYLTTLVFLREKNWALAWQNLELLKNKSPEDPQIDLLAYAIAMGQKDEERANEYKKSYLESTGCSAREFAEAVESLVKRTYLFSNGNRRRV